MQWGRLLISKFYFARRAVAVCCANTGSGGRSRTHPKVNAEVTYGYLLLQKQSIRVMTKERSYVIYCNLEGY